MICEVQNKLFNRHNQLLANCNSLHGGYEL